MKPGWQSSEFAVALVGTLTVALNKKLGLELSTADVLSIVGLLGSYLGSRWHLKAKGQAMDTLMAKAQANGQ